MIKRSPSLTNQVKSHIRQLIFDSEFEDDRIPSETELANDLGVSRTTIRDALSRLENEGVIYRRQGSGTFVNRPGLRIKSRLEEIWSYEAVLEANGYEPSTKVVDWQVESAGKTLAAELERQPGEEILIVQKLFLEDKEPVILARNHIPKNIIQEPFDEDDLERPVFEFLTAKGGQHLSYYLSDIVPVIVDGTLANTLRVSPGTAMISLEEIGYSEDNTPILKAHSYIRDDLLRLRLIRRKL